MLSNVERVHTLLSLYFTLVLFAARFFMEAQQQKKETSEMVRERMRSFFSLPSLQAMYGCYVRLVVVNRLCDFQFTFSFLPPQFIFCLEMETCFFFSKKE